MKIIIGKILGSTVGKFNLSLLVAMAYNFGLLRVHVCMYMK